MKKTNNNELESEKELHEIDSLLEEYFNVSPSQSDESALESKQEAVLKTINHQVGVVSLISLFSAWVWVILAAIGLKKHELRSSPLKRKKTRGKATHSDQTNQR